MSKHTTHKSTPQGKAETLRRKQARAIKRGQWQGSITVRGAR